ncbi:MAG: endonuclease III [Anaerolineaceae bacterium 4572_78]|nr:MAG: endonuclease III [Anaerolineaceae bacterium 4572_78]
MIMKQFPIDRAIIILREFVTHLPAPLVDGMRQENRSSYEILITTILSLRTKDTITEKVVPKLFALANTPADMLKLSSEQIKHVIYSVGFYRNKARSILAISHMLVEKYNGKVPYDMDKLLAMPGVGRKTANLVLTVGFGLPGICVDVHVHRISNRWGYIKTKTPDKTEFALRKKLPTEYWIEYNKLLVTLGQQICHPTSPKCSQCPLEHICLKVEVTRSR